MKRDWQRIVVALVVLVGLTLFVAYHRKKKDAEAKKEEAAAKLVSLDLSTVQKISILTKSGELILERRAKKDKDNYDDEWQPLSLEFDSVSEWFVSKPYRSLPDFYSVSTLLDNLKELESKKVIDEKGERPGSYGLEAPPLKIAIYQGKDAQQPALEVRVGDANSANTGLYVQTSASPRIVLSSNSLDYLKSKSINEFRKKEIFGFRDLAHVKKVDISYNRDGKSTAIAVSRTDAGWEMLKPEKIPADSTTIEALVSDLKSMRANSVVSESFKDDAKKYGFDRPYAQFDVTLAKDKEERTIRISIGGKIEKDRDIYVTRSDYPQIFTVRNSLKDTLYKVTELFVSRKPFAVKPEAVSAIEVDHDEVTVKLEKKDATWALVSPVKDESDPSEATSLLNRLVSMTAEGYTGHSRPPMFKGKPQLTIRLRHGDKVDEIKMVDYAPDQEVLGEIGSPARYYRLKRFDYDQIRETLRNVRNRKLFTSEVADLSSIVLQLGPVKAAFQHQPGQDWVLGKVEGGEAPLQAKFREKATVESVVQIAGELRIADFVNDKSMLLPTSSLRMQFKSKDGVESSWIFGEKEGEEKDVLITSLSRNVTGRIDAEKVETLRQLFVVERPSKG